MVNQEKGYVVFTEEMKKTHTILVPNMLPMHFKLIGKVLERSGYKMELLETSGPQIAETGLKYVHNDTCYPAILVIGQFIDALQSGKYDPDKVALILFQTGGGCRASNYIHLLRKALQKAGLAHVPVISLSMAGLEKHPGFQLTLPLIIKMMYGVLYGDLLMTLVNQCKPYEVERGSAQALADRWTDRLAAELTGGGQSGYRRVKDNYRRILDEFAAITVERRETVMVGIVGEIFVKYSPLGNNNLEQVLVDEGAEVVIPGLLDFCLYCVYNNMLDHKLYGMQKYVQPVYKIAFRYLLDKEKDLIDTIAVHGRFTPPPLFTRTVELVQGTISLGVKMGEGWLLTAEMLELADKGVGNIVCTQPFGCLPNHICGKGMMKPIKERNPDVNIVAIDYDAGATRVNQENRLKLMLANARQTAARAAGSAAEDRESTQPARSGGVFPVAV
ncbi:MAG: 2-hydroxyglutaryl-CoA dehydratase [Oscillospiraceae bacterium]|nr:2-hydroxyglutaryl-CoA dehydratase [Oscillospiraceae bacterium]